MAELAGSVFVFFGCWNSLNKKSNLENSMTTLKTHLYKNPEIRFVVVGGDNFYPDKSKKKEQKEEKDKSEKKKDKEKDKSEKKKDKDKDKSNEEEKDKECTKIINLEQMEKGFNLLPKDIPIYMLLGNHDLETNAINEKKFCIQNGEAQKPEKPNRCTILQHEKYLASLNNNIMFGTNFDHIINNTLLLMIDTIMYDTKESELYVPCYAIQLGLMENNTPPTIEYLRHMQNELIKDKVTKALKNGINNIIIMGHHPITGHKVKKEECILTNLEQPFVEMWKSVLDIIVDSTISIHYLCADIHNYQKSVIQFNSHQGKVIHQYIVGTGGTELDAKEHLHCPKRIQSGDTIITYNLQNFNTSHGFLDCDCSSERPIFTFIPTIMKAEGRTKRKTRTKRKKRQTLRKRIKSKKFRRI